MTKPIILTFQPFDLPTFQPSNLPTFKPSNLPTFPKSVEEEEKRQNLLNTKSVWKQEKQQNPLKKSLFPRILFYCFKTFLNMESVWIQEKRPNPLNTECVYKQKKWPNSLNTECVKKHGNDQILWVRNVSGNMRNDQILSTEIMTFVTHRHTNRQTAPIIYKSSSS